MLPEAWYSRLLGGVHDPIGEYLNASLVARQWVEHEAIGKAAQLGTGYLPVAA